MLALTSAYACLDPGANDSRIMTPALLQARAPESACTRATIDPSPPSLSLSLGGGGPEQQQAPTYGNRSGVVEVQVYQPLAALVSVGKPAPEQR